MTPSEAVVIVSFDCGTQPVGPLREAAYRMIGIASCVIEERDQYFHCKLLLRSGVEADIPYVKARFCDLVTDENLRAKIASETEAVRNVILALAFGSLVQD